MEVVLPRSTSGSFALLTTPGILRNLLLAGRTGRLRVAAAGARKTIWFREGIPTHATSFQPGHPPADVLVRAGRLRSEDLREALRQAASARHLGSLLVELDLVRSEDLAWGEGEDARETLLSLFTLDDGSFVFEESPYPRDLTALDLDWPQLLRAGVARIRDPRVLLRALGSLDAVFAVERLPGPQLDLALDAAEAELVELLQTPAGRSARALCAGSSMRAIDACRLLVALVAAGRIRRIA